MTVHTKNDWRDRQWCRVVRSSVTDFGAGEDTYDVDLSDLDGLDQSCSSEWSTRAFVRVTGVLHSSGGPTAGTTSDRNNDDLGVTCRLSDHKTITFTRLSGGTNEDVTIDWELWEYTGPAGGPNEFIVRSHLAFALSDGTGTGNSGAISTVSDITACVPIQSSVTHDRAAQLWDRAAVTLEMFDDSGDAKVTITRVDPKEDLVADCSVVEFTGSNWTVQEVDEHEYTGTSVETESLSPTVTWDETMIFATTRVSAGGTGRLNAVVFPGSDGTTVKLKHARGESGYFTRAYLVSNSEIDVQHSDSVDGGGTDHAAGSASPQSIAITTSSPVVDTRHAAVIGYVTNTATGLDYPRSHWQYQLTDRETVTWWRGRHGDAWEWAQQVIDFTGGNEINVKGDTVFYGRSTDGTWSELAADLSQQGTDLTDQTTYADETSGRGNLPTELTWEFKISGFDTATPDTGVLAMYDISGVPYAYLMKLFDNSGLTLRFEHNDGSAAALLDLAVTAGGSADTLYIMHTLYPNPDTTGASDAYTSELWVFNETSGTIEHAIGNHVALQDDSGGEMSVGAANSGSSALPAGVVRDARLSRSRHSSTEWWHDWIGNATTPIFEAEKVAPALVATQASGLGDDGEFVGPVYVMTAAAIRQARFRLMSPLVNMLSPAAMTIGNSTDPTHFFIADPDTGDYMLITPYTKWAKIPPSCSHALVRVHVQLWATSGNPNELDLRCFSMNREPEDHTGTIGIGPPEPIVVYGVSEDTTEDDTASGVGHWLGTYKVYEDLLPIAKDSEGWSLFALGFEINDGSADTTTRFRVKSWVVEPVDYKPTTGGIPPVIGGG